MKNLKLALLAMAFVLAAPTSAFAFCGFYVGGAGADLFNDATNVVMMRDGNRTVLSMQNRYNGPVEDFAMVVPVPVILEEANVKTLNADIFQKVDTLTSPRLVEYWEQDPCAEPFYDDLDFAAAGGNNQAPTNEADPSEVVVEAEFTVGEYNIVILRAEEANALGTWLVDNDYNVPSGAEPYYQPYINSGMYFFVAQVDSSKVTFDANGNAVLSPLRFDYESSDFQLPVRLGMINSAGQQDLIVQILARNQRYEVANYPNAFIPTNIEVVNNVRNDFGGFFRSLFARTVKENPGAAITEYSWNAGSCDPCPGPVQLQQEDILTLGGDTLGDNANLWDFVITRIHLRYDKDEVGEDLVFRKADPVVGGREITDENGVLERGATPSSINNFQARYIIRHRWDGAVLCADPRFGQWGGDPNGGSSQPGITPAPGPNTTGDVVFDTNDSREVEQLVREDIPAINVVADLGEKSDGGTCSSANVETTVPVGGALLALGLFGFARRRRE